MRGRLQCPSEAAEPGGRLGGTLARIVDQQRSGSSVTDVPPMGPPTGPAVLPPESGDLADSAALEPETSLPNDPADSGNPVEPAESAQRRWLRWAWSGLGWVAIVVALYFMWPTAFGGHMTMVQVSGVSMEPTFYTKDVLITWKQDEYNVGDIIVYDPEIEGFDDANITHRVIKKLPNGTYVTQGDNRDTADDFRPTAADIKGDVILILPTSKVPFAAKANVWAVIFCGLIAAFCVYKLITMGGSEEEPQSVGESANDDPPTTPAP